MNTVSGGFALLQFRFHHLCEFTPCIKTSSRPPLPARPQDRSSRFFAAYPPQVKSTIEGIKIA